MILNFFWFFVFEKLLLNNYFNISNKILHLHAGVSLGGLERNVKIELSKFS